MPNDQDDEEHAAARPQKADSLREEEISKDQSEVRRALSKPSQDSEASVERGSVEGTLEGKQESKAQVTGFSSFLKRLRNVNKVANAAAAANAAAVVAATVQAQEENPELPANSDTSYALKRITGGTRSITGGARSRSSGSFPQSPEEGDVEEPANESPVATHRPEPLDVSEYNVRSKPVEERRERKKKGDYAAKFDDDQLQEIARAANEKRTGNAQQPDPRVDRNRRRDMRRLLRKRGEELARKIEQAIAINVIASLICKIMQGPVASHNLANNYSLVKRHKLILSP